MGDSGHNRHGPQNGGCCAPFAGERGAGSHLTLWPRLRSTSVPSDILIHPAIWPQQIWTENWGCAPLGEGELGPHLAECSLAYLHAKWHFGLSSRRGDNRHGPKIGGSAPFWGRGAGSPPNTMWQGRGLPACQHSSWSIQPFGHSTPTSQTDRQTDWQDRTDNGPIA